MRHIVALSWVIIILYVVCGEAMSFPSLLQTMVDIKLYFHRFVLEQDLELVMATTPAVCPLMSLLPLLFLLQMQQQVTRDILSASYTVSYKHGTLTMHRH